MITNFTMIKKILQESRTIAVVGLSPKPTRPSHDVALYLKQAGYTIIPVNPGQEEILGLTCYPNLTSIPAPVDVVNIFRKPEDVEPVVLDSISIGAKVVWMQQEIINEKAAAVLGWGDDVLEKQLVNVSRDNRPGTIVGVVKDFHSASMRMEISPVVIALEPRFFGRISVRLHPENVPNTLSFLENTLREIYPEREFAFSYYFIDDNFRSKYFILDS